MFISAQNNVIIKSTLDNSPPPLLNLKLSRPQGQIIYVKCKKIAINQLFNFFFSAIIELVKELVISNMHNRFGKDTWKTF